MANEKYVLDEFLRNEEYLFGHMLERCGRAIREGQGSEMIETGRWEVEIDYHTKAVNICDTLEPFDIWAMTLDEFMAVLRDTPRDR